MRKLTLLGEPSAKQREFFLAKRKHIGYGGARGAGKSWAMRRKFILLASRYPGLRILLLRRTFPELRENHLLPLQLEIGGYVRYKESEKVFIFPNGARIKLGYCDNENDVLQYQGQEYDVIGFEEATGFTEFQIQFVSTCLRSVRTDFESRIYYTCNPGGVGHSYIKRLFIDREFEGNENPDDYVFISARVWDNKVLMKNDPNYIKILDSLPEDLRKAHRDGDWDALAGQFFKEFCKDIHVIEPFVIPDSWTKYVTIDYGLDMLAAYWVAVDYQRHCYAYREVHEPNLIISHAAKRIIEANNGENIKEFYCPPDLDNRRQDSGKSALQIFGEHGIIFSISSNDRVNGWLATKELLKIYDSVDEHTGDPIRTSDLKIFSNCRNLIKHLPVAQQDSKNPNDVSSVPHNITHSLDALRGFAITWVDAPSNSAEDEVTGKVWVTGELKMRGFNSRQIKQMAKTGKIKLLM